MKAAVFYGKEKLRLKDIKIHEPKNDEVLIKVEACGVCGTDKHIFNGDKGAAETPRGTVLGHEFSGVVVRTGRKARKISIGDRVCIDPNSPCGECYYCRKGEAHFCENLIGIGTTINGGFSEFCTVSEKQVYKIPDSMSFEEAALVEPLSCCLHGMDLAEIKSGEVVMIVGGGTIGLIMLQLGKSYGASTIILAEPVEAKREFAKKMGADITFDPLKEDIKKILAENNIKEIDAVIECVGLKSTMEYTIENTGHGGVAMLFGLTSPESEIEIKPYDIFRKEISIKASFINPYTQDRAINLIASGRINVKDLITDRVELKNIQDIFATDKYKYSGKIIVRP